jgi:hypothetical protein
VHELDRVLEGDDMLAPAPVDQVDHRGEGRRLAAAGRPGHQHQALGKGTELRDHLRHAELLEAEDGARDHPQHRADPAEIAEQVDPEPGHTGQLEGEVGVVGSRELLAVAIRQRAAEQLEHGLGTEHRDVGDLVHLAVDPPVRALACGQVEIRRPLGRHRPQQLLEGASIGDRLGGATRIRADPGRQDLVEAAARDPHRAQLHRRQVGPDPLHDRRCRLVGEAEGDHLAGDGERHHSVANEELVGQQCQRLL